MALEPAAAARPFMKKITKYEKDNTENCWVFTLECGHETGSPIGPGHFTKHGVLCDICLRASTRGHKP